MGYLKDTIMGRKVPRGEVDVDGKAIRKPLSDEQKARRKEKLQMRSPARKEADRVARNKKRTLKRQGRTLEQIELDDRKRSPEKYDIIRWLNELTFEELRLLRTEGFARKYYKWVMSLTKEQQAVWPTREAARDDFINDEHATRQRAAAILTDEQRVLQHYPTLKGKNGR